jgi:hypothetical protein
MQLNSVYLYPNRVDAFTNLGIWETGRYRRVYNRNVKIYRSVDNRIDFQVRNSDEKSIAIESIALVFTLIEPETQKLVLQKDCTIVNAATGKAYVILTETESRELEQGFYKYSLVGETRETIDADEYRVTNQTPLYIDAQYGVLSTIEVSGEVFGLLKDSLVVDKFSYINPATTGNIGVPYYTSSIIDAKPEYITGNSLHTFQLYLTDYSGDVVIQGSLSEGGSPHIWADIESRQYENATVAYINVTGKYNFLRVKYLPTTPAGTASFTIQQTILGYYVVNTSVPGVGYSVNDIITIKGSNLGGESPGNDLTITVTGVDSVGAITNITNTGVSYNGVKTFNLAASIPASGTVDKILYR